VIATTRRGWIRTQDKDAYIAYVTATGIDEYRATPGNQGAHILTRDLGDGRTEMVTFSLWTSRAVIAGFVGDDIDVAKFYPEDDNYLIERENFVTHYQVD
jgi:heme-degrading monooxygenase HmoA